jgi:beta-mannanase
MQTLARNSRRGGSFMTLAVFAAVTLAVAAPATAQGGKSYRHGAYDPYGTFSSDARIKIEHVYVPWLDAKLSSLNDADTYARKRGRDLLITVEPWSWSRSRRIDPVSLHNNIMGGKYDDTIISFCRTAGSLKSPVVVRWGHEMDIANKRYPWSQWSPDQYIGAYRHFVDVCRATAGNLKYMWSPRGEANL